MSGTPGLGINNPEGFVNLTTPVTPPITIAVDQSAGNVPIPLSVLPFWRNDGGFRSYGGARTISIFDAAGVEGVSTPDIPAVTDAAIDSQGTFSVSNPDPQKLYKIVVRLRSVANDPNFRDFVCSFRLVTPLEVPVDFNVFDDGDIPNIQYNGVEFSFDADAPTTEIRLRDGTGGQQVPSTNGTPWPAGPKQFMLRQLQNLRDGILAVDFFAGAGLTNSSKRQLYHYHWDGSVWVFTKLRSRDFPSFDPYSGSDLGFLSATIDRSGGQAFLDPNYNLYTYGQRFESFVVVGRNGFLNIDPHLVMSGATIDISAVVDFTVQNLFHRWHLTDQYVTVIATTEEKIVYRQIPLWPSSTDLVSVEGERFVPGTTTPIPTDILRSRLVVWPWIEFPNLSDFLNVPPGGVGNDPAGGIYPDLLNIRLYDGVNPVPVQTWTDEVELWDEMVELQLPNQGLTIPVLDVRSYLSASSPFYRIEADVRTALSAPGVAYTWRADFPLNVNGEPVLWTRDDVVAAPILPAFQFDEWGRLTITWPGNLASISNIEFVGDVGLVNMPGPGGPFPEDVTYDLRNACISREASYVSVRFEADDTLGGGTKFYDFRVPTTVEHQQLIGSTDINVFFAGNVVVFPIGSLAVVDLNIPVTLIGDVGSVAILNPQEGVSYFTGQLGDGGDRIFSNPLHPYVDVDFLDNIGNPSRVRIPNTFFDLREAEQETFAIASRAHGPTAGGLASSAFDFSVPRARISLGTGEIEFEDDGSGFVWNFAQWQVVMGKTLRRKVFTGTVAVSTPYSISDILPSTSLNEYAFVVFRHQNGFQRVAAYKITGQFVSAQRLELFGWV